jgi:hypothetical protein
VVVRFFCLNKARRGSISAGICDRGATRFKPKSGANPKGKSTLGRLAALLAPYPATAGRVCSSLAPCHRPKLLLRDQLLFMRWLLTGFALHALVVERVDRFTCIDVFFAERIETLIAKTNRELSLFARIARKC